jgi:serine/threonine-protein kinase
LLLLWAGGMTRRSRDPSLPDEATLAQRPSGRARGHSTPPASEVRPARNALRIEGESTGAAQRGIADTAAGTPQPLHTGRGSTGNDAALNEVLLAEEATRAHGFAAIIAFLTFGVAGLLPWLGGEPSAKAVCAAALGVMGLVSAWVWYITRLEPASYTKGVHRLYGWTLVSGVLLVENYVGFFSPVPVVLTLGIYYLGQSSDRFHSFALPVAAIVSYAGLSILTALGVLPDSGLFRAASVDLITRLFAAGAVTAVLGVTLFMARVSRRSMREAIARSSEALLMAQQREAQLAEAHLQLDRALRVAIGKPGRYTGANAGRYHLGVIVGVGAIGEVYEAEHAETGARAAVKLLQADAMGDGCPTRRWSKSSWLGSASSERRRPSCRLTFTTRSLRGLHICLNWFPALLL